MDCTPDDVRLAVKASVLRLQLDGRWTRTPRDTFFRRSPRAGRQPRLHLHQGRRLRGRAGVATSARSCTRPSELAPFAGRKITDQYDMRREAVLRVLGDFGLSLADMDAVCGRGGLLRPIPHGTYRVGQAILAELRAGLGGDHASNLGALIAHELAAPAGKPAFIVDPVVVDESPSRVKITGIKADPAARDQPCAEPGRVGPPIRPGERDLLREGERHRVPPRRRYFDWRPLRRSLRRRQQRARRRRAVQPGAIAEACRRVSSPICASRAGTPTWRSSG